MKSSFVNIFQGYIKQKSPKERFLLVLGLVMLALYFILGLSVIFFDFIPLNLSRTYKVLFGLLLMVYAVFRFSRLLKGN